MKQVLLYTSEIVGILGILIGVTMLIHGDSFGFVDIISGIVLLCIGYYGLRVL